MHSLCIQPNILQPLTPCISIYSISIAHKKQDKSQIEYKIRYRCSHKCSQPIFSPQEYSQATKTKVVITKRQRKTDRTWEELPKTYPLYDIA